MTHAYLITAAAVLALAMAGVFRGVHSAGLMLFSLLPPLPRLCACGTFCFCAMKWNVSAARWHDKKVRTCA